jgi:hypothetical protein
MEPTDKEKDELAFKSITKVIVRHNSPEEIARLIVDAIGILNASDIATEIRKVEETMPKNG